MNANLGMLFTCMAVGATIFVSAHLRRIRFQSDLAHGLVLFIAPMMALAFVLGVSGAMIMFLRAISS